MSSSSLPPPFVRSSKASAPAVLGHGQHWDSDFALLLRPIVRAYLLGYGFTVVPRVLSLLVQYLSQYMRAVRQKGPTNEPFAEQKLPPLPAKSLWRILSAGAQVNRFPTFCATLAGGSTLLEVGSIHVPSAQYT